MQSTQRSIPEARRLIDATDVRSLPWALLHWLGFPTPPLELDATARARIGVPDSALHAAISRGEGVLRALTLRLPAHADVHCALAAVARELSLRVPHLLWFLIAVRESGTAASPEIALAVWTGHAPPQLLAVSTRAGGVLDSDAETLCALAACAATPGDVMRHLRWTEVLGRGAITRRFYAALEHSARRMADSLEGAVPRRDAQDLALLVTSRLLFLAFLETRGWLNGDHGFLANGFAECMADGGDYHRRVLQPLFFGTLNTPRAARARRAAAFGRIPFLNGGLFARSGLEREWRDHAFPDEVLGELFGEVMVRYRFTPRESAASLSETAVDPEILGRAFESLMASRDRRRDGVFYTPQPLVERLTRIALGSALGGCGMSEKVVDQALSGADIDGNARAMLLARIGRLHLLDPACGSGAFLVHALERISRLRVQLGDQRPVEVIRRSVLTSAIHGVDVNPTAVWLCQLRLWLAVVMDSTEDDPMRVMPLPNLDRQIRIGDSLQEPVYRSGSGRMTQAGIKASGMERLRARYARATGRSKVTLARALDAAERRRALEWLDRCVASACGERRDIAAAARSPDLFHERRRLDPAARKRLASLRHSVRALRLRRLALRRGAALPFSYPVHFPHVMETGGFDIVLGNPPWVRTHNISSAARDRYRDMFSTFRSAAWSAGAAMAGAGPGFGGQADLAALFVERACDLARPGGTIGLLLPVKLWQSLAGGGVRQFLVRATRIVALEKLPNRACGFDATVYPSLLVAMKCAEPNRIASTGTRVDELALDQTPGSPWLLAPPDVRRALRLLIAAGTPLAHSGSASRPILGVKTGCNSAFLVHVPPVPCGSAAGALTRVCAGGSADMIETSLLRPVLRGEDVQQWARAPGDIHIVWTHDPTGRPLAQLPAAAQRWLSRWRGQLDLRSDARSDNRWWTLFRTEAARSDLPRVVWGDMGKRPRALVLPAGDSTVPLNSCYVVRCQTLPDAHALATLLNSPLIAAWLSVLAEPARGGYHRYLGWTVAMLPLPRNWGRARLILAPIGELASRCALPAPNDLHADPTNGPRIDANTLHEAVLRAYGVSASEVQPLLTWSGSG